MILYNYKQCLIWIYLYIGLLGICQGKGIIHKYSNTISYFDIHQNAKVLVHHGKLIQNVKFNQLM